jgi:hypothetical protein
MNEEQAQLPAHALSLALCGRPLRYCDSPDVAARSGRGAVSAATAQQGFPKLLNE